MPKKQELNCLRQFDVGVDGASELNAFFDIWVSNFD
jgi:hypothetical protein